MSRSLHACALALLALMAAGCGAPQASTDAASRARDRLQLSAELLDLADYGASRFQAEYINRLVTGSSPRQVATLALIRNEAVANMRTMALGDSPGRDLIDMYVWARLARRVCEYRVRALPSLAPDICDATYGAIGRRVDELAARWMSPERIALLDEAVDAYSAKHPDLITASLFRMVDLKARAEAEEPAEELASDEGMFSPVSDAARQLEQTRITAQQMLWMLARMPTAAGWEIQGQVDFALSSSELTDARAQLAALQQGVGSLSGSVQGLDGTLGGDRGLRGVMSETLLMGGLVMLVLVISATLGALVVVSRLRSSRRDG